MASPEGYDPKVWQRLSAELGLTALAVPESFGGAGAGPGEVAVAVEELGRVLLPSPYLSTAVAALVLAGAAAAYPDAAQRYLPGLADGSVTAALALDADVTAARRTVTGAARHPGHGAAAGGTVTGTARHPGHGGRLGNRDRRGAQRRGRRRPRPAAGAGR